MTAGDQPTTPGSWRRPRRTLPPRKDRIRSRRPRAAAARTLARWASARRPRRRRRRLRRDPRARTPRSGDFSKTRAKSRATSRRARIARSWYLAVSSVPRTYVPTITRRRTSHPKLAVASATHGNASPAKDKEGDEEEDGRGRDRGRLGLDSTEARANGLPHLSAANPNLTPPYPRGCCRSPRARKARARANAAAVCGNDTGTDGAQIFTRARPRAIPREPSLSSATSYSVGTPTAIRAACGFGSQKRRPAMRGAVAGDTRPAARCAPRRDDARGVPGRGPRGWWWDRAGPRPARRERGDGVGDGSSLRAGVSSEEQYAPTPSTESAVGGFRPTRPQYAAGRRTLPPVSEPTAAMAAPEATAAAEPPEPPTEGPGGPLEVRCRGPSDDTSRGSGYPGTDARSVGGMELAEPMPNSSMLVLAKRTSR